MYHYIPNGVTVALELGFIFWIFGENLGETKNDKYELSIWQQNVKRGRDLSTPTSRAAKLMGCYCEGICRDQPDRLANKPGVLTVCTSDRKENTTESNAWGCEKSVSLYRSRCRLCNIKTHYSGVRFPHCWNTFTLCKKDAHEEIYTRMDCKDSRMLLGSSDQTDNTTSYTLFYIYMYFFYYINIYQIRTSFFATNVQRMLKHYKLLNETG